MELWPVFVESLVFFFDVIIVDASVFVREKILYILLFLTLRNILMSIDKTSKTLNVYKIFLL